MIGCRACFLYFTIKNGNFKRPIRNVSFFRIYIVGKEKLTFNQHSKTCFHYISKYKKVGVLPIRIVQSNVSGVGHLSESIYNPGISSWKYVPAYNKPIWAKNCLVTRAKSSYRASGEASGVFCLLLFTLFEIFSFLKVVRISDIP